MSEDMIQLWNSLISYTYQNEWNCYVCAGKNKGPVCEHCGAEHFLLKFYGQIHTLKTKLDELENGTV